MDFMVLAMKEGEKRKPERDDDDGVPTVMKKKRGKEEADQPAAVASAEEVADEEVEEFFAILRRIHAAVKYFGKGRGGSAASGSGSGREMIQAIGRQCSEETNGILDEKKREDDESKGFDLNAIPNDDDK